VSPFKGGPDHPVFAVAGPVAAGPTPAVGFGLGGLLLIGLIEGTATVGIALALYPILKGAAPGARSSLCGHQDC